MCMFVYILYESEVTTACVCECVRACESRRKATCPLNHTQMSVYYRKGRVREEVMNSMCCGWAFSRGHCLQTYHICSCIPGWGGKKGDDSAFTYFLAIFMSDWWYFCLRLSHLLLSVSTSELVCVLVSCVCVRLTGCGDLLFVRLQTGVKPCQDPGEQAQQYSDLSHFLMTHACKHAVLSINQALTVSGRFTHSLTWSGMIECRLSVTHTAVDVTTHLFNNYSWCSLSMPFLVAEF